MREIKFRAWCPNVKKMIYLNFIGTKPIWLVSDEYNEITSELMQFTGLSDKNGKEIYEGDIIRFMMSLNGAPEIVVVQYDERIASFWPNAQYQWKNSRNHKRIDWIQWDTSFDEVIGNIWENPELLES